MNLCKTLLWISISIKHVIKMALQHKGGGRKKEGKKTCQAVFFFSAWNTISTSACCVSDADMYDLPALLSWAASLRHVVHVTHF